MRVVLFLPSIETGGVERNAILVANYFADCGLQVSITYSRIVEIMRARFGNKVHLVRIGSDAKLPFINRRLVDAIVIFGGFIRYLKSEKRKSSTMVLSFQSNIVSIIAARLAGVPIVVRISNHPSHVKYESGMLRKVSEKLKLVMYRYANAVVTNSEVTSEYFRARLPVPVRTIYNPVDLVALAEKAQDDIYHPWLLSKDRPVVIAVGRLVKQKNFSLLIRSFSEALRRVDARLLIVGEGEERAQLESLVKALDLQDCVDLPGYMSNVHGLVARADLFVLSSNYEGLPNALLEALAVGTPAVSTDCLSGPSEILCDGAAGDLVPINDLNAMAEAIVVSLTEPERTRKLFNKAKERLKDFDQNKILEEYSELMGAITVKQQACS